jgi:glycosyltransferase involved in cell wall biosynthesis
MRILLDLQACQSTGSRTRGIGRYSLSLAKAMVRQGAHHDVHLLLNAAFADAVEAVRAEFADLVPAANIHVWFSPTPVAELESNNQWRLRASELIREQAILELRPDMLHVTSLFEGLTDDAVTSISQTAETIPTAVTLYDLIPLINANPYLENHQVKAWYYRKVQALKRADLLLAISESSRQEGLHWLHLSEDKIVNISSAVDERFEQRDYPDAQILAIRKQYGLERPFVMYTGGIDLRKNIEGLIRAFAQLPVSLREQYQLAVVCSAHEHDKDRLLALASKQGLRSGDLVMTGFVPDADLPILYHACDLFVFPSWHEGFGLPALEAMACGAPVIAANTSSLPEVVGLDDALFDPRDDAAISSKMVAVLSDPSFSTRLRVHGLQQAKKFSWDASAKIAIEAFERLHAERQAIQLTQSASRQLAKKPRLAYFSPLPPERSGIADYSAELLPELAKHFEIELIVDQETVSDSWLAANFPIRHWRWFEQHAPRYDRVLYSIGNSTFHTYMLDLMHRFPGTVVLHDFFHSGLIAHLDLTGAKPGYWNEALYRSHGYKALIEKNQAEDLTQVIWNYPCNHQVLSQARGVIVHSSYSKKLAQDWYGTGVANAWQLIPHLRVLPQKIDKRAARNHLGLSQEDFLLCSFGILGPTKMNQVLLDAWLSSSLAHNKTCHLVFVGQADGGEYGAHMQNVIRKSGCEDRIKITGFADMDLFRIYLQAADAAVQLRGMSRGETSGTVLDCMAYGLPTIINNNGSMAELPSSALIKLEEQVSVQELATQIEKLFTQADLRQQLGQAAIAYLHEFHAPGTVGLQYFDAIEYFFENDVQLRQSRTVQKIAELEAPCTPNDLCVAAECLNLNSRHQLHKRIFFDIAPFVHKSSAAALRPLLTHLIQSAPQTWLIEPVVVESGVLRCATKEMSVLFGLSMVNTKADVLDVRANDVFLNIITNNAVSELKSYLMPTMKLLGLREVALMPDFLEKYATMKMPAREELLSQWWQSLNLINNH